MKLLNIFPAGEIFFKLLQVKFFEHIFEHYKQHGKRCRPSGKNNNQLFSSVFFPTLFGEGLRVDI